MKAHFLVGGNIRELTLVFVDFPFSNIHFKLVSVRRASKLGELQNPLSSVFDSKVNTVF